MYLPSSARPQKFHSAYSAKATPHLLRASDTLPHGRNASPSLSERRRALRGRGTKTGTVRRRGRSNLPFVGEGIMGRVRVADGTCHATILGAGQAPDRCFVLGRDGGVVEDGDVSTAVVPTTALGFPGTAPPRGRTETEGRSGGVCMSGGGSLGCRRELGQS
ncbi:UNVERIFIED_CONTAM: hypothetical protein Sangu_0736100 [Sesamum angustifolium]|uniref:Uncharacterized protein n=1 Tax=Sesamum angustifolium TaxID=2727405 RepID=A0AAW2PSQ4_9LAMI